MFKNTTDGLTQSQFHTPLPIQNRIANRVTRLPGPDLKKGETAMETVDGVPASMRQIELWLISIQNQYRAQKTKLPHSEEQENRNAFPWSRRPEV